MYSTSFSYPSNAYTLPRSQPFSISPSVNAEVTTFSLVSGTLPAGLSLNSATGVISGTPLYSGDCGSMEIRAENAISAITTSISFTVYLRISSFGYSQQSFVLSRAESTTLTPSVTGDVDTYSISSGSLINGLSLNQNTGVISGTPSAFVLNRRVTIQASNPLGTKTISLTMSALMPVGSFSYPQSRYVLTKGRSASLSAIVTGDSVTYSMNGQLPTGLSFNSALGAISGTPSVSVTSAVSVTDTAQNGLGSKTATISFQVLEKPTHLEYSANEYDFAVSELVTLTPTVNGDLLLFSVSSGSFPVGLHLNSTTGVITGSASTTAERQSVTIMVTNAVGTFSKTISIRIVASITVYHYSNTQYTLVNGKKYTLKPTVTGEEPSFSILSGSLPDGLSLNSATGVIEGEPIDWYLQTSVKLMAKNSVGSKMTELSFIVLPFSLGLLILIPVLILCIIVALCICCCCTCCKKNTMAVENLDDLKDSLPEPVPAQPREISPSSTVVITPSPAVMVNPTQYAVPQMMRPISVQTMGVPNPSVFPQIAPGTIYQTMRNPTNNQSVIVV